MKKLLYIGSIALLLVINGIFAEDVPAADKDKIMLPLSNSNHHFSDEELDVMVKEATLAYESFMDALRIDWRNDPNSHDTPRRYAKAFIKDYISGCYSSPPNITAFENLSGYDGIVAQTEIPITSLCSHHHAPFTGVAHIAYIPNKDGKVIGLSKLNRIADWFSRRPQVQENLTMDIHDYINKVCEGNNGVAVVIEARHTCCSHRGIRQNSVMKTSKLSGSFLDNEKTRTELFQLFP